MSTMFALRVCFRSRPGLHIGATRRRSSILTIPIRDITAPPNWPKPGTTHEESTAAANWLKTIWA